MKLNYLELVNCDCSCTLQLLSHYTSHVYKRIVELDASPRQRRSKCQLSYAGRYYCYEECHSDPLKKKTRNVPRLTGHPIFEGAIYVHWLAITSRIIDKTRHSKVTVAKKLDVFRTGYHTIIVVVR
jgi:hypothetical protein